MKASHLKWMQIALEQARRARRHDEVPVGAVVVSSSGKVLSQARNQTIEMCDPSAHAEMTAIRRAAQIVGNYRLLNTTLYVTIEPCVMCMGAVVHARMQSVVFGAPDPKWGAAGSLYDLSKETRLNHRPQVVGGVCEDVCRRLMQDFFRTRRGASISTAALESNRVEHNKE